MNRLSRQAAALFIAMAVAAGLAVVARPTIKIAGAGPSIDLKTAIPATFGDWRVDTSIIQVPPAPDLQAKLDATYDQTLARTYRNSKGQRIMLSVAYGGNQHEGMNTHRPEICYPAQGFQVMGERLSELATEYGVLPIKRVFAVQGRRNEPITYWVVVGDQSTRFGIGHKLATLKYGLTGKIPDGMLVRVSSIDRDEAAAYGYQEQFIRDLLKALPEADRARIAGRFGA